MSRMSFKWVLVVLLGFVSVASAQFHPFGHRFESNVRLYEAMDKTNPPPQNAILLVGDSQFYRWKTVTEDLPGYTIINRGIDSLQTSDLIHFADRLVLPYHARQIFVHIGGNDIHNGKPPAQVLADVKTLVAVIHAMQPDVPIVFSSLLPGPGRWPEADRRRAANQLIQDYIATQPGLSFINLWDPMLGVDGKPRPDLWVADRVHANHAGYLLRAQLMRPLLGAPDQLPPASPTAPVGKAEK